MHPCGFPALLGSQGRAAVLGCLPGVGKGVFDPSPGTLGMHVWNLPCRVCSEMDKVWGSCLIRCLKKSRLTQF